MTENMSRTRLMRLVETCLDILQAKALEKDALLHDVTSRLTQLLREKEELQMQNMVLQLRCDMRPLGHLPRMEDTVEEVPGSTPRST
jgi:hypothetical protein